MLSANSHSGRDRRGPGSTSLGALAGVFLLLAAPARAEEPRHLSLLIAAGLDGVLAVPDCHAGHPNGRTVAHLVASLAAARQAAAGEGRTVVGSLQLGDFTGPGALSRYLVSQPQGAARLARIFGGLTFSQGVLGKHWFDESPELLAGILQALPAEGGPTLLSANVSCTDRADCTDLNAMPARGLVDIGDATVTLIGATDESVLKAIDPAVSKGLSISSVPRALRAESSDARAKGSQLVIAAVSLDGSRGTPPYLDQLSEVLPDVDLVVINQLGRFQRATTVVANADGATLVVAGATPTEAVQLDFDALPGEGRWKVTNVRAHRVSADQPEPAMQAQLQSLHDEYCAAWSQKLPVAADPPVDRVAFLSEVLETMRSAARTEVAIMNERVLSPDVFPISGPMARSEIFAALRYDDALMQASVTGAWLTALWSADTERQNSGRPGLAWLGIEAKGDALWVNGRLLDEDARYSIAVPDFLARGGDGWITDPVTFTPVHVNGQPPLLTELVLRQLSLARPGTAFAALDHPDLSRRFRWSWSSALTLSVSDLQGANQTVYADSRLLRPTSTVFGGDLSGLVQGSQVDHDLRLSVRARYYTADVDGQLFKLDDEGFVEALYGLKTLRHALGYRWYAPIPYAAATLDTELSPTPGEAYRQMELGGAVGVRFALVRPLEVKVAFGARSEMLDPSGRVRYGANVGYDLPRFSSLRILQTPIDLESSLDYFVAPDAGSVFQEMRVFVRVLVPLIGPVGFTAGFDMFLYQDDHAPVALLAETTAGLTIRVDGAHQQF